MVSRAFTKAFRLFQLFCTIIILALAGNAVATAGGSAIIRFDLFVAVFALLSLVYLILSTFKEQFVYDARLRPLVDIINVVWFLCASIATAALLGVHSCTDKEYLKDNGVVQGSTKICREAQATTAFLFFGLFAFIVTLGTSFLDGGGVDLRSSNPAMSQVSTSV